MDMKLQLVGYVYEGADLIGHQEITIQLPSTDDLDAAHLVLGEGQQNWGKISEQVGIMAVWDAGRVLQKRINERDDAVFNATKEPTASGGAVVDEDATGRIEMDAPVGEGDSGSIG